ncbi:MAG: transaldolase [Candidatus Eisenbacteria bacterium]|uniref:Transaldolase n=1 Tax=Eiseniibacteriota bacterium TaxID=2212470 RepID=A0A538S693_UNCEI|nr:MAG: transaldolase [Candidatus Eisenbacteria bacterium]
MKKNPCVELHELGQSVWLDTISDGLIRSGELKRLIDSGTLYGVTSNPTIFKNAIAGNKDSYPDEIMRLASAGKSAGEIFDELSARDIVRTADLLAETFRRGTGRDGFVSLEVKPSLAFDTDGTIVEARRLWKKIQRPNLFVKVPATPAGIPAIEALIAEGISINVTLTFSAPQYVTVAEAFKRGIDRRIGAGLPLDGLHSVASIFVSRLDTSVDKELEEKARNAPPAEKDRLLSLRGRAAVANALHVWEEYRSQFFGPGYEDRREAGARPQWLLWASTGTKNPAYSDVKYVEELEGPDTINTMPRETLDTFLERSSRNDRSPCSSAADPNPNGGSDGTRVHRARADGEKHGPPPARGEAPHRGLGPRLRSNS